MYRKEDTMKLNVLRTLFIVLVLSFAAVPGLAQKRGSPSVAPARPSSGSSVRFRLLANYDFVMTNPSELNSQREAFFWNSTTATQGSFNNMNGFTVGGSYYLGEGFLGVEYSHVLQELANTLIAPGTYSVKDTFNYDTVYIVYDWVFNKGANQSYELGLGIGQAIKYQYHNIVSNGGVTEDLFWQATPMVFKARAYYSYHFSNHVRARLGATYENATSSSLKADSNHPTVIVNGTGVVSGQTLKNSNGSDTKVDISGLRLSAGIVVAF